MSGLMVLQWHRLPLKLQHMTVFWIFCVFINKGKISFIANVLAIFVKTHINFKNVFYIKTAGELIVEQGVLM